ncbi:MAG: biotin/lipoyl-containing protein [Methanobacteriota archaeon]
MRFTLRIDGRSHEVDLPSLPRGGAGTLALEVDGVPYEAVVDRRDDRVRVRIAGKEIEVAVGPDAVQVGGEPRDVTIAAFLSRGGAAGIGAGGEVRPPLPGRVVAVKVAPGAVVKAGDTLVVLEAMKMQNDVPSPISGVVREVLVKPGVTVEAKDVLVRIEPST